MERRRPKSTKKASAIPAAVKVVRLALTVRASRAVTENVHRVAKAEVLRAKTAHRRPVKTVRLLRATMTLLPSPAPKMMETKQSEKRALQVVPALKAAVEQEKGSLTTKA